MEMTRAQYEEKTAANTKITGFGPDVRVHMPCPFCAEPDFISYLVIEVQASMAQGATCAKCSRGARAVFVRTASSVRFEIVQTCGDTPPEWARMRRIEAITVGVMLNGAPVDLPLIATFDAVVKAAGLTGNPSITVSRPGAPGFIFSPGQTHELAQGDRINAVHTGNA